MVGGGIGDATDLKLAEELRARAPWSDGDTFTLETGNPQTSSVAHFELTVTALPTIKSTCTDGVVIATTTNPSSVSVSVSAAAVTTHTTTPTTTAIPALIYCCYWC